MKSGLLLLPVFLGCGNPRDSSSKWIGTFEEEPKYSVITRLSLMRNGTFESYRNAPLEQTKPIGALFLEGTWTANSRQLILKVEQSWIQYMGRKLEGPLKKRSTYRFPVITFGKVIGALSDPANQVFRVPARKISNTPTRYLEMARSGKLVQ